MDIPGSTGNTGGKRLAAAVVMREGLVLLVRRSETERFLPRVWGVPCGKLEPGESSEDGVLRELKEETGLLGEVVQKVGESSFVSEYRGQEIKNWQENFLVRPLSRQITLPEPDQDHRWLSPDELHTVDIDDYNVDIVRQALTNSRTYELTNF
ncbi:NUDIX hydrolase [Streptomyces sp. NPDC087844]|uniref:NUDIX hydrolase n=1 Tax=Streptomyces sp. NPDC087844 TaxID=3365805 RepID=UPI0038166418